MKPLALILLLLAAIAAPAQAEICARGVYRSGCARQHGAAVVHGRVGSVGVAHPVYPHPVSAHPYLVPICSYHAMGERVCP
jgi:hypothetical protein